MKKQVLLIVCLLATIMGYANDFEVDGIYYGINDDGETVYVTSGDVKYSGEVVIPSTVTYDSTTYSVTSIGKKAFYECSGLTSVTIPESVTNIGEYAFDSCSGLTSVTIPESVSEIGKWAFTDCSGLTKVEISDIAAWCNIVFGNVSANPLYNAHNLYLNGELVTNLEIPESATKIGNSAFVGCSGLTSVTIPESVTTIGNYAFENCSGLTSVTIPKSVTKIGGLAFYNCSGLTSVTIPESVTKIGENAFAFCCGLTSVVYNAENCTSMGVSVFYGCNNLTALTIGENVKTIPRCAFKDCSRLTSVTIPESVTSIGDYAFMDCTGLMSFTSLNVTPPTLPGETTFEGMSGSCQLYVPKSSVLAYKTSTGWTFFTYLNVIPDSGVDAIETDTLTVTVDGGAIRVDGAEGAVIEVYSLGGMLLYRGTETTIAMQSGAYLVKVAGKTQKVVL